MLSEAPKVPATSEPATIAAAAFPIPSAPQAATELATPSPASQPGPKQQAQSPDAEPTASPAPAAAVMQREVTVVPGVPRYHTPECLLIRFMGDGDLEKMTLGAARDSGCSPCRACLPDQPAAAADSGSTEPEPQAVAVLDVLPRRLGQRAGRAQIEPAATDRPEVDGEHLTGDELGVLGQRRRHLRIVR